MWKTLILSAMALTVLTGCQNRVFWDDNGRLGGAMEDREIWNSNGKMATGERKIWVDQDGREIVK